MLAVRAARPEDYPHFQRLFPELGVDDPIPDAPTWWSKQGPTTLVAELEGAVRGYLFYDLPESTLYVRHVVSDPAARRTGIGRALLEAAIARARSGGAQRWCLNVKPDNVAAIALYEALGLRVAYDTAVLRIPWGAVQGLPPSTFEVRAPQPHDDSRIESALNLLGGQLRQQRTRPSLVLLATFGAQGEPTGISAFDPKFPGAFPFRAKGLEPAAALLREMAVHRVAFVDGDWRASQVQLVVEGDDALAAALRSAGATQVLAILHLNGPLPVPDR